ncbi:ABC transporter ATP-binding protein [Pseudomonas sp. 21LCFQ02]|uniref:ABC transporter ATP-binding protein n=1 Tax=unclassified Pseudomonas TaxID=196821 RepID=UPI00209B9458|nr:MULTISPECIES: ABC transporter ATP-binding protein [unclassified Pseudomonas]MCO8171013.1 ABC transporter ATP-binding protein [Pseudomonas sp. 21LCFQ02]MCQ9425618.1 ABC transporter ATP-binding protein [Pseudomonas sp. LJDD11]
MLEVENVCKEFKLYNRPWHRLKEIVLRRSFHRTHRALDGISFTVAKGETLGILGRNGAGKSTLLKMLNGVLLPDAGQIRLSGRVTGLLELGTGFDPNLSGMQNIVGNGLLLGMTREQIEERRQAIVEFSELGQFIHEPIRTYSSGMNMRLAFSIAIHADPETFLIDEALSVGDGHFQQKCMRRIKEFRANGGSIIFVSHDLNAVKMICDRAIVLSEGKVVADGNPEDAVNVYNQLLGADDDDYKERLEVERNGYGTRQATMENVVFKGLHSQGTILASGDTGTLDVTIAATEDLPDVALGLMVRDRFGQDVFGTNSHYLNHPIAMRAGERKTLRYSFPMRLAPGKYTITLALHDGADHTVNCYHWHDNAVVFEVAGITGTFFGGICDLAATLEEQPASTDTFHGTLSNANTQ